MLTCAGHSGLRPRGDARRLLRRPSPGRRVLAGQDHVGHADGGICRARLNRRQHPVLLEGEPSSGVCKLQTANFTFTYSALSFELWACCIVVNTSISHSRLLPEFSTVSEILSLWQKVYIIANKVSVSDPHTTAFLCPFHNMRHPEQP